MATIAAAVGWLAGLFAGPALPPLGTIAALALLAAVIGVGVLWRGAPATRLGAVALVFILLGVLRAQSPTPPPMAATARLPATLEVRGVVRVEPERTGAGTRLRLAPDAPVGPGGHVLVTVPDGDWRYGDLVVVRGRAERPLDSDAAPLGEMYARQGIGTLLEAESARLVRRAEPVGPAATLDQTLYGGIYALKAAAAEALDRRLAAPTAALARGLLLGGTSAMPPDLVESFRRAGMTHVVAVSGYNVALVAAALLPLGRLAGPRWTGLLLSALGVAIFTLAVGAPASALRAAVMACLALLARQAGRPADALAGLAVASAAMTAIESDLLYDMGFQLSSLATLGLIAVYPRLESWLAWVRPAAVRDVLAGTLAVEVLTVPTIAIAFGRLALLSPVANVLALPAVPAAMATSALVILAAPLPDALAAPLGWIAWVPLAWIVAVVEACATPTWASLPLGRIGSALIWAYYAALAIGLLALHARSYRAAAPSPAEIARGALERLPAPLALGGAALAGVAVWAGAFAGPPPAPRVSFFEASGAALIQAPSGRALLVDPGADGRALAADLGRTLPFWQDGLDLVLLTTDGPSTAGAVPELLRRYRIGQIVAPPARETSVGAWRASASAAGVPSVAPTAEVDLDLGGAATLRVLPLDTTRYGLMLSSSSGRVLLLGDSAADAQRAAAEALEGTVDLVWLGRGGTLQARLVERLEPRVVVARGRAQPTGVPDRLTVLRSEERGTVEMTLWPSGYEVRTRR